VRAQLQEEQLDTVADQLDELDWTVAQLPDGYLSVFAYSEDDEESLDAASRVADISKRILLDLDIDGELERVVVSTQRWREREAFQPSLPELLATKDISAMLGVSRQRVCQLRREHQQFPDPVMETGAGPLWTRSAVDWFVSAWNRRPGCRPDSPEVAKNADARAVVELRPRTKSPEDDTDRGTCRERVKA
jgi:hypothetical protein